jgi:hypothetical protein
MVLIKIGLVKNLQENEWHLNMCINCQDIGNVVSMEWV